MLRSFKLKIALFAAGTSGLLLMALAAFFLSVTWRAGIEQIDRQLTTTATSQLRPHIRPQNWARFDETLAALFGATGRTQFLIRAINRDGAELYASPLWPEALRGDQLQSPDLAFADDEPDARPRRFMRGGQAAVPPRMRVAGPKIWSVTIDRQPWRFVAMRNTETTLFIGMDMSENRAGFRRLCLTVAGAAMGGLLLLAVCGWLLARQALKPVAQITRTAAGITVKDLGRRIHVARSDREFQALADVLNAMLNRLEASFHQAARFSADAAHELKTPLAILQGQLSQALQQAPVDSDAQRTLASLLDEVQRLKAIIRKLLLLAQSDAGQLRLTKEPVNLTREIEALLEDAAQATPSLTFRQELEPDVTALADPDLLRQVLRNLFSNAAKYNRPDGVIAFSLHRNADTAVLTVANTIPPDTQIDKAKLFERFYRGDPARNRSVDGSGLGLSLAREICRAHGGDLGVATDEQREDWLAFTVTLPLT